jgi:hypothetical protein
MLATFFGRRGSELAPEDAAALDAHLTSCPKCAAAIQSERAFDDRVTKAMLSVPVPAGLKSKLLDGVAAQRGSWYRQSTYYAVGLAASILVVIGGFWAWNIYSAPELTWPQIVSEHDYIEQDRAGAKRRFLAKEGIQFHPEQPLDLYQVEASGITEFQGKLVPYLYFVNSAKNARATVYVVRDSDFKWKNLSPDPSTQPSVYGFQVARLRDLKQSDVGYIVVFTGAGLDVFLENRSSS